MFYKGFQNELIEYDAHYDVTEIQLKLHLSWETQKKNSATTMNIKSE